MTARRVALVAAVWFGLAALLVLLQRGRVAPTVFADELTYGRLAQNIADGLGKSFQGLPSSQRTLYPYVVAPAWVVLDGVAAYRAALAINAVVMTSVVVPTFLLARSVARFRIALAAAAAAALVPSMTWAGMLMTESLAYPAAAWALLAMVVALRRPGLLTAALVAVALAVAYLGRTQLVGLAAAFVLAVLLDVVRGGRADLRAGIVRHRWVLGAAGLAALGAAAFLASGSAAGGYACVTAEPPTPAELAGPVVDYAGTTLIAFGVVPGLCLVALAVTRGAWTSSRVGPLLCVAVAASAVLLVQAAWTVVTTSPELQERYVFYAAPAAIALVPAAIGLVRPRTLGLVTAAAALYCAIAFPGFADVDGEVLTARLGLSGPLADVVGDQRVLWAATVAVLGGVVTLARVRWVSRAVVAGLALTATFSFAVVVVRQLDANAQSADRKAEFTAPLTAVDDAGDGRAAIVLTGKGSLISAAELQLFNTSVDRVYRVGIDDLIGVGQACPINVNSLGLLELLRHCAGERALPTRIVLVEEPNRRVRPDGGMVRELAPGVRLWERPPGTPARFDLVGRGVKDGGAGAAGPSLVLPPTPPPPSGDVGRCNGS